ncbi:uncharacterized protein LOC134463373 [Engraulis encrasicolus]|uniref:uncharacterized protein LOC134463373 n=1 Tax=Engraulis encrasicolus TaxID=184585 RepID=UPI002FD63D64
MTEGHTLLQMEEYAHEGGTLVRRRFGISFDEESSSSSSIDTRSDMRSSSSSIGARPDMRSNDVYQERPFHNDPSPSVMREDARFLQMEEYAHEDVTLVRRRFGISFDEESSSSSSIDTRSDMRSSSSSIGARPDMRSNDVYQERPFHNDPSPSVMREDARSFQIIEPNRRGNVYLQRPLQEFPPRYIRTVLVPEVPVPEYLTVDWVRATAVRLRWRLPDGTSENQYKFRISCHSEAADPLTVETIDQSYWVVIRFLRPATEYIINVFTLTQCGRRSQSCTKIIHTGQNDADIQREKEKTLQAIDAIPAWGKEMLRRSQNGSEPEPDFRRRDAGRGHHVINNAMLSILTDVLKKVLHRLKFRYDSSDLERLSKYLEYDFNSSARNDIQNVMVAHIRRTNNGDLPADLNSSLFGFHSLILTEVMCMDMINLITGSDRCPRDLGMSPKLHWIIEEMMMRMSYVDKIAKDHWIRNCADRTNKFKARKADVERHLRCGLKHFKTIIGELQNIYRNGLPISCCLP